MIHDLSKVAFVLALLGALVVLHITVRVYWPSIKAALKGELGRPPERQ
jgi:hypothetical protein